MALEVGQAQVDDMIFDCIVHDSYKILVDREISIRTSWLAVTKRIWNGEKDLDHDELVRWTIEIVDRESENKRNR